MYVRLSESDKVGKGRDSSPMMQETEISDLLYEYEEHDEKDAEAKFTSISI